MGRKKRVGRLVASDFLPIFATSWKMEKHFRKVNHTGMNEHFVVNLGRQLGSGGHEIGERLARRLGIAFFDKELIRLASEASGLGKEFFERADERTSQRLMSGFLGMRFPFISESTLAAGNCLSDDALFKVQSDVIRRLAEQQSCLFVGRCADYILRNHPRCVNLFISATPEARVERLCAARGLTPLKAEELMEKADKRRAEYYNFYTFKQWGAAASYHLCIDATVLGVEGTVDFAEAFIRRRLAL